VTTSAKTPWLAAAGLLLLCAIPLIAGAVRMSQLAGGAPVTPDNARFFAAPIPVMLHIPSALLFCAVGAFQFVPGFRRRKPGWHRVAGRVLVASGLVAALSGLWMTLFYARPAHSGDLLAFFRILAGSGMLASIVLGFAAIRRRDFSLHRAWMMRGYAIGMGAGTQVLTLGIPLLLGATDELSVALGHAAGWLINITFAEYIIRRRPSPVPPVSVRVSAPRPAPARPARA